MVEILQGSNVTRLKYCRDQMSQGSILQGSNVKRSKYCRDQMSQGAKVYRDPSNKTLTKLNNKLNILLQYYHVIFIEVLIFALWSLLSNVST
jgi:hypothetical protein